MKLIATSRPASLAPATIAEQAAAAAHRWERRGLLGRLVRLDEATAPATQVLEVDRRDRAA